MERGCRAKVTVLIQRAGVGSGGREASKRACLLATSIVLRPGAFPRTGGLLNAGVKQGMWRISPLLTGPDGAG